MKDCRCPVCVNDLLDALSGTVVMLSAELMDYEFEIIEFHGERSIHCGKMAFLLVQSLESEPIHYGECGETTEKKNDESWTDEWLEKFGRG